MVEQTQNQTIEDLEKEPLRSEINLNISKANALESSWWFLIKYAVAGLVAGGLLTIWFVGYFQPFSNIKQERANLKLERQAFENQKKLTELINQNKILGEKQKKAIIAFEKLRQDAEKSRDNYLEQLKKNNLSSEERENYAELVKQYNEWINSFKKEIKQLKTAQEETAIREKILSESHIEFNINGVIER